ncbi:MAG: tyrosine-type recombinase/integrase [Smithella sp.]|nr:tyrosine-type recombinase/integrase [Smithella sp.]MDD5672856.1 tyrosine-type recombinase/integrase [Chitinivibrionales bacterium]
MDEIKLHQFAEKLELLGYSKRSIKDYPYDFNLFLRYLEEKENVRSLSDVTPEHITAYHTHLQYAKFRKDKYLVAGTVIKRLEAIRLFYRLMFSEGLIEQDYSHLVVTPKQRRSLPRNVPTEKEMFSLLEAIPPINTLTIRDRALLELMYATGIRSEEVRSVNIENLDLTERTLFVTGKGSKDRLIPIGDWVLPYLLEYLAAVRPKLINPRDPLALLFVSKNGLQITGANLGYTIRKYAKKAGLDLNITPHTFRHACATHLLKGGADIRYVQELLGHADLSTTQIYTKIDISFLKQAHKKYHPRERLNDGI